MINEELDTLEYTTLRLFLATTIARALIHDAELFGVHENHAAHESHAARPREIARWHYNVGESHYKVNKRSRAGAAAAVAVTQGGEQGGWSQTHRPPTRQEKSPRSDRK